MIHKFIYIMCLLLLSGSVQAQLEFEQNSLKMGQVEWNTENMVAVTVHNKSTQAVTISNILTSSSQLVAEWSKAPIAAGASIQFTVKFKGDLLGHFNKAIYVYTDAKDKPDVLYTTGCVVREKDSYEGDFPYKVGDVLLNTDNIEFDDVNRGDNPEQVILVRNGGQDVYHPELMHLPKYLTQRAEPEKLLPGRSGRIVVTMNTKDIEGFGLKQTTVYVSRFPGDRVGKDNEIEVSSVILPPFDTVSVIQTTLAPCLEMNTEALQLPSLEGKSKVKGTIELTNTGKSSLEIRALQVFNPAVNVNLGHRKIAPNQKVKLKISVLAKYMNQSRGRLRVLMITNDPKRPKVIIPVSLGAAK